MKKLALIGCGGIGGFHLSHFMKFNDVEIAGFCDVIPERAEAFVKQSGQGKAYSCYLDLFDDAKPDMVFIGVPPTQHGDIEREAIKRGIPFFVQKPIALDMDLAREIRDAAEARGLITASGFQSRYSDIVNETRRFVNDHQIAFVSCERMGGVPEAPWWKDKSLSGGQLVEQTIHQLDIIRYFMGEPVEVCTFGTRGFVKGIEGYNTDDITTTIVRFESGALGEISTGCYAESGACFDSKVTFSAKDARLDHYILSKIRIYGEKPAEIKAGDNNFVVKGDGAFQGGDDDVIAISAHNDGGLDCDRAFIDAVISGDGSKIRSPYADAVKTMAFALACNRSMAEGRPVRISEM